MEREKYNKIIDGIAAGYTLEICTYTRCTHIDRKVVAQFRAAGYEVMKNGREDEPGFYIRSGKRWDYVTPLGCTVRLV